MFFLLLLNPWYSLPILGCHNNVNLCGLVRLDMVPNVDQDVVVGGYEKKQRGKLNDHTSTK